MKPRCREAGLWISTKVDGEEIPPAAESFLERHLASCARCRRVLEEEGHRAGLLTRILRGDVSEERELSGALAEAVACAWGPGGFTGFERGRARPFGSRFASRAVLAAAAAFAAAVGLWWWNPLGFRGIPGPGTGTGERVAGHAARSGEPAEGPVRPFLWVSLEDDWLEGPAQERGAPPRMREVHRVRDVILDLFDDRAGGAGPCDVILDTERVGARDVQFTGWTYH